MSSYSIVDDFKSVNSSVTAPTEIGVSGARTSSEKRVRNSFIAITIAAVAACSLPARRSSMTVIDLLSRFSRVSDNCGVNSSDAGSIEGGCIEIVALEFAAESETFTDVSDSSFSDLTRYFHGVNDKSRVRDCFP